AEAMPLHLSRLSRRSAPTNTNGIKSSPDSRTSSSISWTNRRTILRHEKIAHIFDRAIPRDAGKGIHPDAPGSADVRDDDRHSVAPADSVWLRDQCRSETFARGRPRGRSGPRRSYLVFRASEQRLLRARPPGED